MKTGENSLRLEIDAQDARDGLWIEPVLRGDFVITSSGRLQGRSLHCRGNDWSQFGYPHYSGSMDFEQTFYWEQSEGDWEADLVFRKPPGGTVEIFLNDLALGSILWAPWRLPIREGLKPGLNRLRLRVTNTLQNFILGKGQPSGPLEDVEIQIFSGSQGCRARLAQPIDRAAKEFAA